MSETAEARLKRLSMRSWRRGLREMDLILGPFSDQKLGELTEVDLKLYDQILEESDRDLYQWIMGDGEAPDPLRPLLDRISAFADTRL